MAEKITMTKISLFFLLITLTVPCMPEKTRSSPAIETTDKFTCTADTYVDSANPDLNYASADLHVSYYPILDMVEMAYLAFSVSEIPTDAVISVVKFEISVKSMPLDDHSVTLGVYETSIFSENTLTWNNQPDIGGAKLVSVGTINEDSRWVFTLSDSDSGSLHQHSVTGNGIYYFMLITSSESMWSIVFDDRTDTWNPPKLAITYQYTSSQSSTSSSYYNGDYTPTTRIFAAMLIVAILGVAGFGFYAYFYEYKRQTGSQIAEYMNRIFGVPKNFRKQQQERIYQEWRTEKSETPIQESDDSIVRLKRLEGPKFCPNCGKPLVGTPRFCSDCGHELN